jgi:two-component system, OmpR family, response regulator CpxR
MAAGTGLKLACSIPPLRQGNRNAVARLRPGNTKRKGVKPEVMRPKKVILCVDDNEQDLSVLTFMLSTNGYKVMPAISADEAIAIFVGIQIDLVLADFSMPQMNGAQLVKRLKQIAAHVPMILLGDPQAVSGENHLADAMLAKKNCSPLELLERIKIMSARKRGPRKGTHRLPPPPSVFEQLAAV